MNATRLSPAHKANFETLLRAAKCGDLALVSCYDRRLRRSVPVLCALNLHDGEKPFEFVPLGMLVTGDPYRRFSPPR